MTRQYPWEFTPLDEEGIPTYSHVLVLESSDVFVLWRLGTSGPMILSDIKKPKLKFPSPEKVAFVDERVKSEVIGKPYVIDRTSLLDSIKRVIDNDLIAPINNSQKKSVYCLTFSGLIWYFYHFWNQEAFKTFYKNYNEIKHKRPFSKADSVKVEALERIMPILPKWNLISTNNADALLTLEKYVRDIYNFYPVPESIKLFDVNVHTKS